MDSGLIFGILVGIVGTIIAQKVVGHFKKKSINKTTGGAGGGGDVWPKNL